MPKMIKLSGSCQLLEALLRVLGSAGGDGTRIEWAGRCQVRPAHGIRVYLGPWCVVCGVCWCRDHPG